MRQRALVIAILALAPSGAAAHTKLSRSSPSAGAVLAAAPKEVDLHFAGPIQAAFSRVAVMDAAGRDVREAVAPVALDGKSLRAPLRGDLADGAYEVRYEVVSADGHRIEGSFRFEVRTPAAPAASP